MDDQMLYYLFLKRKYTMKGVWCNNALSFRENLQNLEVCQICNLIWQHTSQFIIVKVSVEHNLAVSKRRQHSPFRGDR
jgi:hypothetical protein